MSVSVLAGLGNPGIPYAETRHNLGFRVIDALASRHNLVWKLEKRLLSEVSSLQRSGSSWRLVKPQTFVNASGGALHAAVRYFKVEAESVIVIYDDIHLELGRLKINREGGPGGHNGVRDVIRRLGNRFIRFRVGIGAKYPPEIGLADFVLGKLTREEADLIQKKMEHYLQALAVLMDLGPESAMNQFNRRENRNDPDKKIL
ncbi:MAG: aminoacyl-tRNA hydrolase [Opitutae bacterium]|nr:aminoacyl-tRNA hydrolase [Opitutae bacterium]MBC9888957.1 aminoacyl-tRNA hydrolase [Opitutae bacterium]